MDNNVKIFLILSIITSLGIGIIVGVFFSNNRNSENLAILNNYSNQIKALETRITNLSKTLNDTKYQLNQTILENEGLRKEIASLKNDTVVNYPTITSVGGLISHSTSELNVTGSIYYAKILSNGNYIYAAARGPRSGIAEVTPDFTNQVFTYHNSSWLDLNGPEWISKLANGNYVVADCDASDQIYEIQPNGVKKWIYDFYSAEARVISINGINVVMLCGWKSIRIIDLNNQGVIWELTDPSFTYINNVDYQELNGMRYLWAADCYGHKIFRINYDMKKIDRTFTTDAGAGPYSISVWNSSYLLVGEGTGGPYTNRATIRSMVDGSVLWSSPVCSGLVDGVTTDESNKFNIVISDTSNSIKTIMVSLN
jgi:hypothetical protein